MTKPHDTGSSETLEQAKNELEKITTDISEKEFKIVGLGLTSRMTVQGIEKAVPKTLSGAYEEMNQYLKDPVRALAVYYAHLRVAVRPEHDHASRHEETRKFYQAAAARKGDDIFPDNTEAAKRFDDLCEKITNVIAEERSLEQREYLEFQNKLKVEVDNTQAMKENFEKFKAMVEEINPEIAKEDVQFLNQVIDRMQTAISRKDVNAYANDASLIIDCILLYMDIAGLKRKMKPQVEAQMQELKDSVRTFENHHSQLMTSLEDKKEALYISSALQAAAIVAAGSVSHLSSELPAKVFSAGLRAGAGSGIKAGMESGSIKLGRGLKAVNEEVAEMQSNNVSPNVYEIDRKKQNLSDIYAEITAGIKAGIQQPETQEKLIQTVALAVVTAAFPPAAAPLAAARASYAMGNIAQSSYSKHRHFKKVEKKSVDEKMVHEGQMQKYLHDSPNKSYQKRISAWEAEQVKQASADHAARSGRGMK